MSLKNALKIIDEARKESSSIILLSSASGKDSVALLDMLSKNFDKVVCVFMYMVKDLSFINKYISYQEARYKNCKFVQVPHHVLLRMVRYGELGVKPNRDIRLLNLSEIAKEACKKYNIEWACFGFKKDDSLHRRLMLNTYELSGINRRNKKIYPLADWGNKDVLAYIKANKLIPPIKYDNRPSSDVEPKSGAFLSWCKKNYPNDYEKIIKQFPLAGAFLYEYENQ